MKKYFKGFWDYRFLLSELVKKGIRLKYRRSYLGIIWSLIEPLLNTIVLVIVFGSLGRIKDVDFPLYIVAGRLIFTFFKNSTSTASKSIRANAPMIKKVYVPKYLYPLSGVLYNYVIFLISLIVLFLVEAYCRVLPTWHMIQLIPALLFILLISIGVGFILCTLNVFFRDIEYLWNVICTLIFYCSAVMYYPKMLLESPYGWILKYNPIYQVIDIVRSAVMGYDMSAWSVQYCLIWSIGSIVLGLVFFKKKQDEFILHI